MFMTLRVAPPLPNALSGHNKSSMTGWSHYFTVLTLFLFSIHSMFALMD